MATVRMLSSLWRRRFAVRLCSACTLLARVAPGNSIFAPKYTRPLDPKATALHFIVVFLLVGVAFSSMLFRPGAHTEQHTQRYTSIHG